ncbi:DNA-binding protein [Undibacterium arcticum]
MARETNTRELVREIAEAALIRGEKKPTQAMVRRQILEQHGRTASPNVVTEELNSFLIDSASVNAKRFSLPGLPAAVSESVTALWTIACDHANDLVADKVRLAEQREIAAEQAIQSVESQLVIERMNSIGLKHDLELVDQALNQKGPHRNRAAKRVA